MKQTFILILGLFFVPPLIAEEAVLPAVRPEEAGMSSRHLEQIDTVVEEALARKEAPGVVVLIGRHGKTVFRKAYGFRATEPVPEAMTPDTVFDLASLTKVVATATSVMTLVERGLIRLADTVIRVLPEFGAGGGAREDITIEQLLLHRGGFAPSDPMDVYFGSPAEIFARKYRRPLIAAPGSKFIYSDTGYEVLGELIKKVTGKSVDVYARETVFEPLGMNDTEYRPLVNGRGSGRVPVSRIAPTERKNGRFLRGEVHDPRAFAMGGISGHAGLFSSADDLALYSNAILTGGGKVLSRASVAAMTRVRFLGDRDIRGLGWDIATAYSSNRGDLLPIGSFGHTGWTGTSVWIDPTTGLFIVILGNRNHPDGGGNLIPLRSRVATIAAAAITGIPFEDLRSAQKDLLTLPGLGEGLARASRLLEAGAPASAITAQPNDVVPGIEVLEERSFTPLARKRIAILTNQTGRTRDGRSTIDVLRSPMAKKQGIRIGKIFTPEHGLAGDQDGAVSDTAEPGGAPVRSLYGREAASRRPRPEDLEGIDSVVIDLQDSGTRFYTYFSTVELLLETAAVARVGVLLLDRPNPIGGDLVEGPVTDVDKLSFTAPHPVPVRHGMTLGELSLMVKAEKDLNVNLEVVPMTGYQRSLFFDETGLPWVNPSPNLRSLNQMLLYPGTGLFEQTNLSAGRGTEFPFETIGAPWLDHLTLARTLANRGIKGVRFTPVEFIPAHSQYAGEKCRGIRISIIDRYAFRPVALGMEIATALRDLHAKEWKRDRLNALLASSGAMSRFERGETAAQIVTGWNAEQMEFERRRAAFLLYPMPEKQLR